MSTDKVAEAGVETIRIREPSRGQWMPVVGSELKALLKRKQLADRDSQVVESETCRILAKCTPPSALNDQRTGLIIGYVQSGKTLSFTALTALARDNLYRLVIVLGGTTTNLVDQSYARLSVDLAAEQHDQRIWALFANPGAHPDTMDEIGQALRSWREYPDRPERCPTVVIVAMKNHRHLNNLSALLKACDAEDVSTLIIDDEGDQAGLNNKVRQKEESTTYSCIRVLRRVFATHTYLLYTATPQAPLLISRIDMLSPQFADVIDPGQDYVGGRDLFKQDSPYIEVIPQDDLPTDDSTGGPPNSLEKALRLFFVGAASGYSQGAKGNRSMMIHPSQRRELHKQFLAWVRSTRTSWLNLLRDSVNSPDRRGLIEEFRDAHKDLATTEPSIPSFEKVSEELEYAIHRTQVSEVNASAGRIPTIRWRRNYSFLLVGGTGLDRGFTVEGLTVTYMPRGAGVGNADTVQQRGRFFGYKREYIGLIRIFLEQSVAAAFRNYVEHERSIRGSLIAYRDSGKSLSDWRRAFFLDRSMSPTRSSVLSLDYMRGRSKEWTYARQPQIGEGTIERNRQTLDEFIKRISGRFEPESEDPRRTAPQRHLVARSLPLAEVYRDLLVPLTWTGEDLLDHLHVLLQIERALEGQQASLCDVYRMNPNTPSFRSLDKEKAIKNLMQGENARSGYPGDRAIRTESRVSVQLRSIDLKAERGEAKGGKSETHTVAHNVPVVAVYIPEAMRVDSVFESETA